jgi:hypothetical protein
MGHPLGYSNHGISVTLHQDVSDYGYPISLAIGLKQPQLENTTFKNSVAYFFQSGVPAVILS